MLHKRKENYLSMKIDPIFVNEAYIAFDKCIDIIDGYYVNAKLKKLV